MAKIKQKNKKKNTKEKDILNLDNEIIIGIKTLPKEEPPKTKKKNKKINKKTSQKQKQNKERTVSNTTKRKNVKKVNNRPRKEKVEQEDELELSFEIEDKTVNNKNRKKPTNKRKTTKQQEIAKKKRKATFRIIKWTTLVVLLLGGGIYFLLSPFFNIKSITTSGNEKILSEELISLSGIQLEENTFKISKSKVEQAIKTNAYVETIKVKRKLPDKIELQIVERKPAYMLTLGNAYVYINKQGYLLEISKTALELPTITGFLTPEDQIEAGKRLCAEDLQRLSSVIQIMDAANNNEIGKLVTKINISDKQNYILELKSEKKTAHIGDTSNLSTKMLYIKTVIEKEKKNEGDIFVNTDLSNKGAVFREKV